jgi:hypothetical protein
LWQLLQVLNSCPVEAIRVEMHDEWEKNTRMSGAERWRMLKVGPCDAFI